ncbi:HBL/NHE enterotoxin family protein [Chengkuizengella sediminis]|uniref:HBL/NHE enterotoxin family protein n=1 Tax=Chengkuizengella sediminis TaxID=1885917 RepID=UPI001389E0E8|nr:HBL/NHE enterotoxin family protein [Chengkuizengella sediminis]NDI35823.1 HBL/NHE enterotoxin family protein [Chengkuizengella sediminis]
MKKKVWLCFLIFTLIFTTFPTNLTEATFVKPPPEPTPPTNGAYLYDETSYGGTPNHFSSGTTHGLNLQPSSLRIEGNYQVTLYREGLEPVEFYADDPHLSDDIGSEPVVAVKVISKGVHLYDGTNYSGDSYIVSENMIATNLSLQPSSLKIIGHNKVTLSGVGLDPVEFYADDPDISDVISSYTVDTVRVEEDVKMDLLDVGTNNLDEFTQTKIAKLWKMDMYANAIENQDMPDTTNIRSQNAVLATRIENNITDAKSFTSEYTTLVRPELVTNKDHIINYNTDFQTEYDAIIAELSLPDPDEVMINDRIQNLITSITQYMNELTIMRTNMDDYVGRLLTFDSEILTTLDSLDSVVVADASVLQTDLQQIGETQGELSRLNDEIIVTGVELAADGVIIITGSVLAIIDPFTLVAVAVAAVNMVDLSLALDQLIAARDHQTSLLANLIRDEDALNQEIKTVNTILSQIRYLASDATAVISDLEGISYEWEFIRDMLEQVKLDLVSADLELDDVSALQTLLNEARADWEDIFALTSTVYTIPEQSVSHDHPDLISGVYVYNDPYLTGDWVKVPITGEITNMNLTDLISHPDLHLPLGFTIQSLNIVGNYEVTLYDSPGQTGTSVVYTDYVDNIALAVESIRVEHKEPIIHFLSDFERVMEALVTSRNQVKQSALILQEQPLIDSSLYPVLSVKQQLAKDYAQEWITLHDPEFTQIEADILDFTNLYTSNVDPLMSDLVIDAPGVRDRVTTFINDLNTRISDIQTHVDSFNEIINTWGSPVQSYVSVFSSDLDEAIAGLGDPDIQASFDSIDALNGELSDLHENFRDALIINGVSEAMAIFGIGTGVGLAVNAERAEAQLAVREAQAAVDDMIPHPPYAHEEYLELVQKLKEAKEALEEISSSALRVRERGPLGPRMLRFSPEFPDIVSGIADAALELAIYQMTLDIVSKEDEIEEAYSTLKDAQKEAAEIAMVKSQFENLSIALKISFSQIGSLSTNLTSMMSDLTDELHQLSLIDDDTENIAIKNRLNYSKSDMLFLHEWLLESAVYQASLDYTVLEDYDLLEEGILLFEDNDYTGNWTLHGVGDYSSIIPDNTTSSIYVNEGAAGKDIGVILYPDSNYGGAATSFTTNDPNLSDNGVGTNNASSMKVRGEGVHLFETINYKDTHVVVPFGNYPDISTLGMPDDVLSSLFIVGDDYKVTLYEGLNYTGRFETFTSSDVDMRNNIISNNAVSSLKVHRQDGVYLFSEQSREGDWVRVAEPGIYNNIEELGFPENTLSSIKVIGGGYEAVLFEDLNQGGASSLIRVGDGNLTDNVVGNNTTSSIVVTEIPDGVYLYDDIRYRGTEVRVESGYNGYYENLTEVGGPFGSGSVPKSIRIVGDYEVELYENENFNSIIGTELLNRSDPNLTNNSINPIQSLQVNDVSAEGVYLYKGPHYTGEVMAITATNGYNHDHWELPIKFDNQFSSIRIVGDYGVVLYPNSGYGGTPQVITSSVPYMEDTSIGNNTVSSLKARGEGVYLFDAVNYKGLEKRAVPGSYDHINHSPGIPNDTLSSVLIIGDFTVDLKQHYDFGGLSLILNHSDRTLIDNSFNDITSSLRVKWKKSVVQGPLPSAVNLGYWVSGRVTWSFPDGFDDRGYYVYLQRRQVNADGSTRNEEWEAVTLNSILQPEGWYHPTNPAYRDKVRIIIQNAYHDFYVPDATVYISNWVWRSDADVM